MNYTLSLTRHAAETLQAHLLGDRSREQMAITLCGVNRLRRELRLLVRDVILLPPDAFRHQTAAYLELKPEVQAHVHRRAHQHRLVQVDWHSHPAPGLPATFSAVDDRHEAAQALYLAQRMDGVPYGSVVVSPQALDARLWIVTQRGRKGRAAPTPAHPQAHPLNAVLFGDLQRRIPLSAQQQADAPGLSAIFDRQVRAFGAAFQRQVAQLRVGVVGLGGLGSALAAHLARMGVRDWVLVDPDVVELSNLNRLVNATLTDAQKNRPKVYVARSSVRQAQPQARVRAMQVDAFDPAAQRALKACDLLILATDNHSSRMALNRLAAQYPIPLLHVGFNISVGPVGNLSDVSGELVIPDLGQWCLQCAGIVNPQQAGWELASDSQRDLLRQRGYVTDTPAPAVGHLDGVVAALAAAEVHNLASRYKPQQRYLTYDALRGELAPLQVTPSGDCPVCSLDHGVLGLGDLEPLPDYTRQATLLLPPSVARPLPDIPGPNGKTLQTATPLPDRTARARRMRAALDE